MDDVTAPEYLSYAFGSLCMCLWTLTFIPQLWDTYKRGNTHGLAYEYMVL